MTKRIVSRKHEIASATVKNVCTPRIGSDGVRVTTPTTTSPDNFRAGKRVLCA